MLKAVIIATTVTIIITTEDRFLTGFSRRLGHCAGSLFIASKDLGAIIVLWRRC